MHGTRGQRGVLRAARGIVGGAEGVVARWRRVHRILIRVAGHTDQDLGLDAEPARLPGVGRSASER
jgi:hypothetical protein